MADKEDAAWVPCDMCGDYVCSIHGGHVSECGCPAIDVWVDNGYFPYEALVTDAVRAFVRDNPYSEAA